MKRTITVIALACIFTVSSFAEAKQKTEKFSAFTGIEVYGNIVTTLQEGKSYSVSLDVDARVIDYVTLSITGTVLKVELLEKKFPNELKAQLRKKENILLPTNVVITAPFSKMFDYIEMSGNSVLTTKDPITFANPLKISTFNNSSVINFEINGKKVELNTANNSSAQVKAVCDELLYDGRNNSSIEADIKVQIASFDAWNNSNIIIKGSADKLIVSGKNNSSIDALQVAAKEAEVQLANNCECNLKAIELLNIVSVVNGASLIYMGEPVVKVGTIVNSSVSSASQSTTK